MKNTNDFSKCKVGDKLWSIQLGGCDVERFNEDGFIAFNINNKFRKFFYYKNGNISIGDKHQSIFFSNPNIIAPEKPREKIPFDLEKALSGEYYLVTRDGRKVQEWKWFETMNQNSDCILAVIGGYYIIID